MKTPKFMPFPEAARLLEGKEANPLQALLASFLRGEIKAKWPVGDTGIDVAGHYLTPVGRAPLKGRDLCEERPPNLSKEDPQWPKRIAGHRMVYIPTTAPPLEPISREEWRTALPGFSGLSSDIGIAGFNNLARIPLSAYLPSFRKAYIDSLHISEKDIASWGTKGITGTIGAENKCEAWLQNVVAEWEKGDKQTKPKRDVLKAEAMRNIDNLTERAFRRAWNKVVPDACKHEGRPKKA